MTLSGGKRKVNKSLKAWVTFVKKVQKEEKLSYKDAIHRAKVRKDKGEKWMSGGTLEQMDVDDEPEPALPMNEPELNDMNNMNNMLGPVPDMPGPIQRAPAIEPNLDPNQARGGKRRRRTMRRSKGRSRSRGRSRGRSRSRGKY